jgi:hypothetical protein
MQLTSLLGHLKQVIYRTAHPENYTTRSPDGSSETRARLRYAADFVEEALIAIKAHNKDPKENPLP